MLYFRQFTDSFTDNAMVQLRMRYGWEGQAIFIQLKEFIAKDTTPKNLTFELQYTSNTLAHLFGVTQGHLEDMIECMIELRLLELTDGRITCNSLREASDDYTTKILKRNEKLECRTKSDNGSKSSPKVKQNKVENIRARFTPPTREQVAEYVAEKRLNLNPDDFIDYYTSINWMRGKSKMTNWKNAASGWSRRQDERSPQGSNSLSAFEGLDL